MSNDCSHDCSSCSSSCNDRTAPNSFLEPANPASSVGKVIGVVSGKGGVGKSLVTELLAVGINRQGRKSAILDADITGPSIPKAFGISGRAEGSREGIYPVASRTGIDIMSINLLLDNVSDPVIWRGPVIAGTVRQFWSGVIWKDVDTLLVDMPPGTGDVPLTVFQSLPVDGIIIVTSPQELVSMIVSKAVKMAQMMNIPIIGIIENMSYITCPDCGRQIPVFGESHLDDIAAEYNMPVLGRIPIDPGLAKAVDNGLIEDYTGEYINDAVNAVMNIGE